MVVVVVVVVVMVSEASCQQDEHWSGALSQNLKHSLTPSEDRRKGPQKAGVSLELEQVSFGLSGHLFWPGLAQKKII